MKRFMRRKEKCYCLYLKMTRREEWKVVAREMIAT